MLPAIRGSSHLLHSQKALQKRNRISLTHNKVITAATLMIKMFNIDV